MPFFLSPFYAMATRFIGWSALGFDAVEASPAIDAPRRSGR